MGNCDSNSGLLSGVVFSTEQIDSLSDTGHLINDFLKMFPKAHMNRPITIFCSNKVFNKYRRYFKNRALVKRLKRR